MQWAPLMLAIRWLTFELTGPLRRGGIWAMVFVAQMPPRRNGSG